MKIIINDQQKLSEIKDQFHDKFQYLKIEFFSQPHKFGYLSKKKFMLDPDKKVGDCRDFHIDGFINASGKEKVWEIEEQFQKYGLPIQVFRLSGNKWIETAQTDSWTLDEQNLKGKEHSTEDENAYDEAMEDFDLYYT